MAPIFKAAKGSRFLFNTRDLSEDLNNVEANATVEMLDVTTFVTSTGGTTNDKRYINGHRDGQIKADGLFDAGSTQVDNLLRTAMQASSDIKVSYGPGSAAVGDVAVMVSGPSMQYDITSMAKEAVAVHVGVQANQTRLGWWLISPVTSITSSGNQAGVVDRMVSTAAPFGSALGGTAFCHCVSATTSTGQVKVQHSTDGVTFADLLTFNISSGRSVQRSTVAGAIKEQLRGSVVKAQASGFNIGLTFARNMTV